MTLPPPCFTSIGNSPRASRNGGSVGVYERGGGAAPAWVTPARERARGTWIFVVAIALSAGLGYGGFAYARHVREVRMAAARHLGLALQEYEELAAAVSLGRHLLSCRQVELVGDVRDLLEALLVELREERTLLEKLDFRVLAQSHRANISPSGALATVIGWTSFRRFSARRRVWRACCSCSWDSVSS